MDLRQHQWSKVVPIMEELRPRKKGTIFKMKPMVNGLVWIFRTGESWADLPRRFSSPTSTFRLYRDLVKHGLWNRFLCALADDLREHGNVNLAECFASGNYDPAKCRQFIRRVLDELDQLPDERDWRWYTLLFFLNVKPEGAIYPDIKVLFQHPINGQPSKSSKTVRGLSGTLPDSRA